MSYGSKAGGEEGPGGTWLPAVALWWCSPQETYGQGSRTQRISHVWVRGSSYGKTHGQLQTPVRTQGKSLHCSERSLLFLPLCWLTSSPGTVPWWVCSRGTEVSCRDGDAPRAGAAAGRSAGTVPGDRTAVGWPRGDEVMNNLRQVVISQDEVEAPCQLGMTGNITHGRPRVRGIQKHGSHQAVGVNF